MPEFKSFDGVRLVFDDQGAGPPVLLLHGFMDSADGFHQPRISEAVLASGRRVVSPDARGHGRSEKPHDLADYEDHAMAKDVSALLDHLDLAECDVVGYSMGALTAMRAVMAEPRVKSAVLGGVGGAGNNLLSRTAEARAAIADALIAEDASLVADPTARGIRSFAESTGADRHALAAILRSRRITPSREELASIGIPTLVIAGDEDDLAGSPHDLAAQIPGARAVVIKGTHESAVTDPALARHVVEFLAEQIDRRTR